ncbi:uncharacterized protein DEA37_0002569 [Paragonimus westermani]|uniref:C2H2-type domain-containing protein n=1 Tax=Paragonimus westermani TaxID=34504 RepID=A0A5J4N7Z4_9TREM|nr:uncharacterized protein DEA37_0002569 [Paragonimus westermani]
MTRVCIVAATSIDTFLCYVHALNVISVFVLFSFILESYVENVTQPKSSSESAFNSSKLHRIASPRSSAWALPVKSSSAPNVTGASSDDTTTTTVLGVTPNSTTTAVSSSLSMRNDISAGNCNLSASVTETIPTSNYFGGLTNDVVSTRLLPGCEVPVSDTANLLHSIQHALLRSSLQWYPHLANRSPLHVPVSFSLFDATASELKPDVFGVPSPALNSPMSWSSADLRPIEEKLVFNFSPPFWTKHGTSVPSDVSTTDVKKVQSAPVSLQTSKPLTPTFITSVLESSQSSVPLNIGNDSPTNHHCPDRDSRQHSTNRFTPRPAPSSFNQGFKLTSHASDYSPWRRHVSDTITTTTVCSPRPSHDRFSSKGSDQLTSPGLSELISAPTVGLGSSPWISQMNSIIPKSTGDVPNIPNGVHSNLMENVAAPDPPYNSGPLTTCPKTTIHPCFPDSSMVTSTRTPRKSHVLSSRRSRISAWSNLKHTVNAELSKTPPIASTSGQFTDVLRSDDTKTRTSVSARATSRQTNTGGVHVCTICCRQFTRSDMLARHAHVHTGHRPFECSACGQAFSRSDHLSTHQRTHTGQRPYRCPLCSYSACRRDMITRHLRVHQRRAYLCVYFSKNTWAFTFQFQLTFDNHPVINSPHSLLRCHFHLRPNVY